MHATDVLMAEHRIIERFLACLEEAVRRLQSDQPVRLDFFIQAADFIQDFADAFHHKKEEGVLFEALAAHGVPREFGPIGVMLAEHDEGRKFTRAMRTAVERMEAGDDSARVEVVRNALGYVALLRQHIAKEEQVLFAMAEDVILEEEQDRVAEAFKEIETGESGEAVRQKYLRIVETLEREVWG